MNDIIEMKWVKRSYPSKKLDELLKNPAYKLVSRDNTSGVVAFRVPKVAPPEPRRTEPETWDDVLKLATGKVCTGQKSIQKEINDIAKAEGGNWQKRIQDKKWREKTRKTLREANPEGWCDYRENQCSCE